VRRTTTGSACGSEANAKTRLDETIDRRECSLVHETADRHNERPVAERETLATCVDRLESANQKAQVGKKEEKKGDFCAGLFWRKASSASLRVFSRLD